MALDGTIRDFELTEIFQMIQHQKKDGTITLTRGKDRVWVHFKEGRIIKAIEEDEEETLLNLLVKAGKITLEQLKNVLNEQNNTKLPLPKTLVALDIISRDEVKRLNHLYTEEFVFRLFEWKSGRYTFEQKGTSYDPDFIEPLSIEFTLMEAVRRIDEWPLLLKKIPSRKIIFEIGPSSKSGLKQEPARPVDKEESFGEMSGPDKTDAGRETSWLLQQINGERTVQEIIDLAQLGAFSVYTGLVDLLSNGNIRIKEGGGKRDRRTTSLSIKDITRREKIMKFFMGGIAVGASIFLITLSYPSMRATLLGAERSIQEVKKLSVWNELDTIRYALEVYYLKERHYPKSLHPLLKEGLFREGDIHLDRWTYRVMPGKGGKYHLAPK